MILGIIPARMGSKGVPGKNMIDLGGRPLLDYTLASAICCKNLDRIVLTTNIPEAIEYTRLYYSRVETPFVRPESLSSSTASMVDVVLHVVDYFRDNESLIVEKIVLLQPTCPFRQASELDSAIQLFQEKKIDSLVGVSRVWHHPSDYIYRDPGNHKKFNFVFRDLGWLQRQDFPEVMFMTGALYICRTDYLRGTRRFYDQDSHLFQMSEETMIDIDLPFDLKLARGLLAMNGFVAEERVVFDAG